MNVSRGGYVIINLDEYTFGYSYATEGYEEVPVEKDIITLIKYAYEKGKPVCINNIKIVDENGTPSIFTTMWGVVTYDVNNNYYTMPRFIVNVTNNTLKFD